MQTTRPSYTLSTTKLEGSPLSEMDLLHEFWSTGAATTAQQGQATPPRLDAVMVVWWSLFEEATPLLPKLRRRSTGEHWLRLS